MKPLTENAQQKNSDTHIYFVTQEIVCKTLRLNLSLLAWPKHRVTHFVFAPNAIDCVTNFSRKYVSFLINLTIVVYRLSSIVYRLPSGF